MDIAINKPAKAFLKQHFEEWYTGQILGDHDIESVELEAIDIGLETSKKLEQRGWSVYEIYRK